MKINITTKRAQALLEYIGLLIFVMAAFIVFQQYIARGFAGGWKKVGDTFGLERQFSPDTIECVYDIFNEEGWYTPQCYRGETCGNPPCDCHRIDVTCGTAACNAAREIQCYGCIQDCITCDLEFCEDP